LAAATSEQDSVSGKFFMDVFKDVLNETEVSPSKFILVHALLVIIDLLYMKRIEVEPISEFVSKIRNFRDFQINYQLNIDKTNVKELIYLLCLPLSKFDGIDLEDVHRSLSRIKSDFGDSDSTILRTGPTTYIGYKIRREILYD
ncbi:MAG TPA: hypothetical protein VN131_07330, partial [Mobilitalea sp.]|nr:hypothetical protein [Mobilitalea sp.]